MTETSAAVARRGMTSLRPSDLAAWDGLAPEVALALRDGAVALAARLPSSLAADVGGIAVLTVARHYLRTQDVTHAVRAAVMGARQVVLTSLSDGEAPVPFDPTDGAERVRLETWQATRPDAIAQTNDAREAFRACLDAAGDGVAEAWEVLADAYLQHDPRVCRPCLAPGARPGRVGLTNVRAHVAGLPSESAESKRLRRADGATVAAVTAVLAPLVAGRPSGPVVWDADRGDLWATFGLAWAMVEHGDAPDLGRTWAPDRTPGTLAVRVAGEACHEAREAGPSDHAAWRAWDALVPRLRDVGDSLGYGRALRYDAAWDAFYLAGAPESYAATSDGRDAITAEAASIADVPWQTSGARRPGAPVLDEVNGRPLTEAEAATAAKPTARRERFASHAGEGDDSATTAPNLRDVSPASGQLRAFKPVVSPRKRAAGQTGPTVPHSLQAAGATLPRPHDADRAARYAARVTARALADAAQVGKSLPED